VDLKEYKSSYLLENFGTYCLKEFTDIFSNFFNYIYFKDVQRKLHELLAEKEKMDFISSRESCLGMSLTETPMDRLIQTS
jgi:hypothetical protein